LRNVSAKHGYGGPCQNIRLYRILHTAREQALWNRYGTRVAPAQHLLEKPHFPELRHCAATPSSEQSTRGVPFRARLFGQRLSGQTVWRRRGSTEPFGGRDHE
jgi:hypothetical protein